MEGIQQLVLSFDGSDDLVGSSGQFKGFRFVLVSGNKAVDGGLQVGKGIQDATLEASSGELGEVALDGVEPGPNLGGAYGRRNCRG